MSTESLRNFPQSLELGDDLIGRFCLPTIPGYTEPGEIDVDNDVPDMYWAYFSDAGNAGAEFEFLAVPEIANDGTPEAQPLFVFEIDTGEDGWRAATYHFRIEGRWTRDGIRRTFSFSRGLIQVLDSSVSGVDALAHAQSMVLTLREVIKQKLDGTADLASYTIGERNIALVPIASLRRELRRYEDDLVRLKGGYPAYDTGTDVV